MSQDVISVYRSVIDEVVTKCRTEFVQEGVDEAVLDELRVLWEEKLQHSGALGDDKPAQQRGPTSLLYQQQVYGGATNQQTGYSAGGYQQQGPPAGNQAYRALGQPSPYQQPRAYPQPGGPVAYQTSAQGLTYQSTTSAPYQQQQGQPGQALGQAPAQYSQPPSPYGVPTQQHQGRPVQSALQYSQASSSYGIPVQSQLRPGQASTQPGGHYGQPQAAYARQNLPGNPVILAPGAYSGLAQPHGSYGSQGSQQPIGAPAPVYGSTAAGIAGQSVQVSAAQAQEDVSRKRKAEEELAYIQKQQYVAPPPAGQAQPPTQIPQQDGPADDGKEDDADNDDVKEEAVDNLSDVASDDDEDEEVSNQCISQFTKVQRTKTRWKCQLKAGILHLNGRDYVFNTATGEMQF